MNIYFRQTLTTLFIVICNSSVGAEQQTIGEKSAEQSVAAQRVLDGAEKAGMPDVHPPDAEQPKNNPGLFPKIPPHAGIPGSTRSEIQKVSKINETFIDIKNTIERGDQVIARNMLVEFVHRWPANTHARLLLAKLEILQGDPQQAQLVLLPLMLDENSGWQPWFWSGTAKLEEGLFEQARADLQQAAARDARVPDVWIQRAVVEQKTGNYIAAVQLLQVARQLAPDKPEIHLNLAFSNEQLGEFSSALKNYQMFLQTSADSKPNFYQARVVRRISELLAAL